jgi:hypothetical protein
MYERFDPTKFFVWIHMSLPDLPYLVRTKAASLLLHLALLY